jgi:hypothetical protein
MNWFSSCPGSVFLVPLEVVVWAIVLVVAAIAAYVVLKLILLVIPF